MGKRSRVKARHDSHRDPGRDTVRPPGADVPEVGPRQPCPCGSGRRYKACHGAAGRPAPRHVTRPFAGLRAECDLVAMRDLVPAATAPVSLATPYADGRDVLLASLLPGAAPAMVREDGTVWLGLQVQHAFGDPSRELAAVLLEALDARPGAMVGLTDAPGEGPRLQDVLVDEPLQVTVHQGFEYWVADRDDPDGSLAATVERANAAATPSAKVTSAPAAYWASVGSKEHLRWVMPHDEDDLLDALARLHAAGKDGLVEGSRFVGMFRAHGLLAPVWDLPVGTGAEALEAPAKQFAADLAAALADSSPLTSEERSARSGLANRQLTIR